MVELVNNDATLSLALDTLKIKKQGIIFVNTKRGAEKVAEDIAKKIKNTKLINLSEEILKALSKPTKQCERLAACVKRGVAFHHSGLTAKQRELIEDNFRNGTIKIIAATPTLCLSKDTKIWHNTRETKVNKFKTSNQIYALSKNKLINMKVQKIKNNGNSSELIKIHSVSDYKIKVTPNHKMFIKRNNKKILIKAKDIKKSDKIATIGRLNINKITRPNIKNFIIDNKIEKNINFNEDISYFIGAMLGDGYSGAETNQNKIKYKGSPDLTGIDKEIFQICKKVCNNLNISFRKKISTNNVPHLILGKNKWFREFLVKCGVEEGDKKYISEKLMSMNLKNISSLIKGLFDTDGCMNKGIGPSFNNTSEKLVKQLQKLLLRFGIISSIRKRKAGSMKIYNKEYKTKISYELIIKQNLSIIEFYKNIGFNIKRKQNELINLVSKIYSNINYVSCENCKYKIYKDLFSGRSKTQKNWGLKKLKVIKLLGEKGELGSNELRNLLNFEPKAKENRLNHHYELINKRKIGTLSKTEWFWSLNKIGEWINDNILYDNNDIIPFFKETKCPLCKNELSWTIKKGWRNSDFDGDIFWDMIRSVKKVKEEGEVYDVVLPNKPNNDHLFVAEGFIVHNSAGLDLPAYRVIMRDLKRFTQRGMQFIPVLEYLQMVGRAGRPKYDTIGEAITIASKEGEADLIEEQYINGEPEEIFSKLAVEPVLRTYLLSLISTKFLRDKDKIMEFFSKTFWAYQFEDMQKLQSIIEKMLHQLQEWKFIQSNDTGDGFLSADEYGIIKFDATPIGKRVAELYLDPLTADHLIKCCERAKNKTIEAFSLIQMISHTLEMRPLLSIRKADYEIIDETLLEYGHVLLDNEPNQYDYEFPEFQASIKTALFMQRWIEEMDEEFLFQKFAIRPGEIKAKLDKAEWLLYSTEEICRLKEEHSFISEIRKLRTRLKYGVKEELIPLLKLKNIGRTRARVLFRNNIKDIAGIKKIDLTSLSQILGKKLAADVKNQVGEKVTLVKENKRKGQISLMDY